MSNELQTIQNELTIERQRNEILELKFQLQKTQAEKASRLNDSLLAPELYEHYKKVAVTLSKSNVIPTSYRGKPEDIFVSMAMGYQLGFPVEQSLQDIAVINGRPCLWGDGLLSLCLNHPACESIIEEPITEKGQVIGYRCTVKRKNHPEHTQVFTINDAKHAGLLERGTVWKSYPTRMLQMRARSLALRDKFADALRGLRVAEIESEDKRYIDSFAEEVTETPKGNTQTEKLKVVLKTAEGTIPDDDSSETTEQELILADKISYIKEMIQEKSFDEERIQKAFDYFKVKSLDELNDNQASIFIMQLEKY